MTLARLSRPGLWGVAIALVCLFPFSLYLEGVGFRVASRIAYWVGAPDSRLVRRLAWDVWVVAVLGVPSLLGYFIGSRLENRRVGEGDA